MARGQGSAAQCSWVVSPTHPAAEHTTDTEKGKNETRSTWPSGSHRSWPLSRPVAAPCYACVGASSIKAGRGESRRHSVFLLCLSPRGVVSPGVLVAVKMASTSRLVCTPEPGQLRAGGDPCRARRSGDAGSGGRAGRAAGQRHFPATGLSGASLGLPSRRRSLPRVSDRRLPQAPPCGGARGRSPWPLAFC